MTNKQNEWFSQFQLAASSVLALIVVLLVGVTTTPNAQAQQLANYSFNALYDFSGGNDGQTPVAGLIQDSAGNLYGTNSSSDFYSGWGNVFEVSPGGTETVLYSFCPAGWPCPDGGIPEGTLIADSAGNLYGTAWFGGTSGQGLVFELSPAPSSGVCPSGTNQGTGWCETVIWNFTGGNDGSDPISKLIMDSAGNLYSTTEGNYYAANVCGSVFELSPPAAAGGTWTENTLYDFPSGKAEGCLPGAGVVMDASGNLYGTTIGGGSYGDGAVYELTAGSSYPWTETVLYSFGAQANDGVNPYSDLIFNGSSLIGTTIYGGKSTTGTTNNGAVFQLTPNSGGSWTETTIFAFTGGNDGCNPAAGVTADPLGNLYGTASQCPPEGYWGSVYELSPPASGTTWNETTLYDFEGDSDGDVDGGNPMGTVLISANRVLYGTSSCENCSTLAGSVWSLTPPTTTTTVTSSLNPSLVGQAVTFTATITSSSGDVKKQTSKVTTRKTKVKSHVVSGTVTWSANSGCGSTAVTSGYPGTATCSTSNLPTGTDAITATYSGDAGHNASSGTLNQIVNAVANVSVASSLNPSVYGQAVYFMATVTGTNPTGSVQFYANGQLFDTEPLVAGTATSVSISTLAVGSDQIDATYSGDANNGGGSGLLSGGQNVTAAGTTLNLTSSENPSRSGDAVTFTLSITAANGLVKQRNGVRSKVVGGMVTWTIDGEQTDCAPSNVSSTGPGTGAATCTTTRLPIGNNPISATYSGDANHSGGTATLTGGQNVLPPLLVPTIDWSTPAAITYGKALGTKELNAKAKYGTKTVAGTFTYDPPAGTILLAGQNQTLTVTFTPTESNTYATATDSVELDVSTIKTKTKLTETIDGLSVTVNFTVTAKYGEPTGSVTVSNDGGPSCTGSLSGGEGSCTLTFSAAGTYALTADYSGDSNDDTSSATHTVRLK
jgi:uncharacterized repeat protein (TIGR03803 family)